LFNYRRIVNEPSAQIADPLDRPAACVRRIDRERPTIGTGKVERIMDAASAYRRRRQSLFGIVAVRGIDVVNHQIEGCSGPLLWRPLGSPNDDVGTAPHLEHRQIVHGHDRAQANRLEPACRGTDIDGREPDVADSHRRPLITGIRHIFLLTRFTTRPFLTARCFY
jgi:hypothetical protein